MSNPKAGPSRRWGFMAMAMLAGLGAGPILHAQVPAIGAQPQSLRVGPGDRAGFVVMASGAAPLSYQWFHGQTSLAGATGEFLLLPAAQPGDAGGYTVKVSNREGAVLSTEARLEVAAYTTAWVDLEYAAAASGPALLLPDGRVLVAAVDHLVMLGTDGRPDDSFSNPVIDSGVGLGMRVRVARLCRQDDGRLLLLAEIAGRLTYYQLRRAMPDGSWDPTFSPQAGKIGAHVLLLAKGKILIEVDGRLTALNSDGSLATGFTAAVVPAPAGGELTVAYATLDSRGRLWAAGGGYLWRLQSDGSRDTTLPLLAISGDPTQIVVQDNGDFWVGSTTTETRSDGAQNPTYHLRRYRESGAVDPGLAPVDIPLSGGTTTFALQHDGRVLVGGTSEFRVPTSESGREIIRNGLVRFLADGSVDESFAFLDSATAETKLGFVWPDDEHALVIKTGKALRINLQTLGPIDPPQLLRPAAGMPKASAGEDLSVPVVAVGPGPLQISGVGNATLNGEVILLRDVQAGDQIVVSGPGGRATRTVDVAPSKPRFVEEPEPLVARPGQTAIFSATVRGSRPLTAEWFKDGTSLGAGELLRWQMGALDSTRRVSDGTDAGLYTLRIANAEGVIERTVTLTVGRTSELANLSVRAFAGTGDEAMIVGVILKHPKPVLFQAVGPELAGYGVDGVLGDPIATLHGPDGTQTTNDNGGEFFPQWSDLYQSTGAMMLWAQDTRSAELRGEWKAGASTIVVGGVSGTSGVALGQLFDAERSTNRIANFSARVRAGRGNATAIAGFIVRGTVEKRLLIRCVGPGLAAAGVPNPLADPQLTLVDQATHAVLAVNDDWETGNDLTALHRASTAVGAFPLAAGSRDAALLVTLPPGAYTALATGAGEREAVVLLEVYDVPE